MARGTFITFEGIDGCGKSTHARILVEALRAAGLDARFVRDPGTVGVAEKIRAILLDPENATMTAECELLLYEAARIQLVVESILPALEAGAVVVSDRFCDSTTVYQGAGRGLSDRLVRRANAVGSLGLMPDRTLVLDISASESDERIGDKPDRMESEGASFRETLRSAYLELAEREPERVRVVDASLSVDEVSAQVAAALDGLGLPLGAFAPEGRDHR